MNINYLTLTPCRNKDFIDLGKCNGYERLCGLYGISLEYCENILPIIGNLNPRLSLKLANDYFDMLDNTYRDTLIGALFEKIKKQPSTKASPKKTKELGYFIRNILKQKKLSFTEEPFSTQFLTIVSGETCDKICKRIYSENKPDSNYKVIFNDCMKFAETLFTKERIGNLNEIVRKHSELRDIKDHDRKILLEVLGKKRLRNFSSFLEKVSKINETIKTEQPPGS